MADLLNGGGALGARFAASLLLAVLAAAPAQAAPKVDVVILQNGTRLVGEIRSMTRGKLELKTDDMGTLQIEWDNVVEVTAPEYFEVEDMEARSTSGLYSPGGPRAPSRWWRTGARTPC